MQPNLLNPVPVYLRKKQVEQTALYDPNLTEPVGQVARPQAPVRLLAQVSSKGEDDPQPDAGGIVQRSDGYLVFRTADLRAARITIEDGDQIVRIGDGAYGRDVNYYVTRLAHRGHYSDAAGATLLKAYYQDRQPSRSKTYGAIG